MLFLFLSAKRLGSDTVALLVSLKLPTCKPVFSLFFQLTAIRIFCCMDALYYESAAVVKQALNREKSVRSSVYSSSYKVNSVFQNQLFLSGQLQLRSFSNPLAVMVNGLDL